MTDTIDAHYDTLGDLTKTLFVFKSSATRLNEDLVHLNPQSPEYRAKLLERDVALRSWEKTAQACEAERPLIERLERERPEAARTQEPILSPDERDALLGIRGDEAPDREVIAGRDDLERNR